MRLKNSNFILIKSPTMLHSRVESWFFIQSTSRCNLKWISNVEKMSQNATMGVLWGDSITIFKIVEYLQRPICIWSKTNNVLMWNKFWIYPTHDYEFQHFEPIQYVNNVPWFSFSLQQNDHEINIKFDQLSNHSQSMTQQSCTSFSQKKLHFYWNTIFD